MFSNLPTAIAQTYFVRGSIVENSIRRNQPYGHIAKINTLRAYYSFSAHRSNYVADLFQLGKNTADPQSPKREKFQVRGQRTASFFHNEESGY